MISRRKVSDRVLENINKVGFFIVIALIVYANGMDIFRAFFGK
jgi:regulator of sigma E protease